MAKWLLTLAIIVVVLGLLTPALSRRGRRLPGDVSVTWRGRRYEFPFGSVLLFSLLAWLVMRAL